MLVGSTLAPVAVGRAPVVTRRAEQSGLRRTVTGSGFGSHWEECNVSLSAGTQAVVPDGAVADGQIGPPSSAASLPGSDTNSGRSDAAAVILHAHLSVTSSKAFFE